MKKIKIGEYFAKLQTKRNCLVHFLRHLTGVGQARKLHETTTLLLVTLPNIHRLKKSHSHTHTVQLMWCKRGLNLKPWFKKYRDNAWKNLRVISNVTQAVSVTSVITVTEINITNLNYCGINWSRAHHFSYSKFSVGCYLASFRFQFKCASTVFIQCFDAVGWAAGRASGL